MGVLHGEQFIEITRPLPPAGTVLTTPRIVSITDKGRAAVLVIGASTTVEGESSPSVYQEISVFARGAGGFGSEGGSAGPRPAAAIAPADPPAGMPPTATTTVTIPPAGALLNPPDGHTNPLHADAEFAGLAGFPRPILHGLATLGYGVRAVMDSFAGGEAGLVRTIKVCAQGWEEREAVRQGGGALSPNLSLSLPLSHAHLSLLVLSGPHVLARVPGRQPSATSMWAVPPWPGAPAGSGRRV